VRHLPNLICVLRIALVWPVATALEAHQYLTALGLFVVAGLSDGVDGYLAKRFNWTSELGKFLDPLADKLLLVTVFVESAWLGLGPWWLTAAVVSRDVLIGLGAFVYRIWIGPLRGLPTVSS
jgi:cardiolipin synthase